jgi:hypothetical protein
MLFFTPIKGSMILVYFIVIISVSISYFFSFSKKYSYLKYLPMLGIVLSLQFTNNSMEVIKVILLYIYMFYIALKDKYLVDYNGFRDLYIRLFLTTLPLLLVVYFSNEFGIFYSVGLPYFIVFNISGLYLMRITRHSSTIITNRRYLLKNIMFIILISSISIILNVDVVFNYVANILIFLFMDVIIPIITKTLYIIFWPVLKLLNLGALGLIKSNKNFFLSENAFRALETSVDGYSFIIAFVSIAILAIVITVIIKRDRFKRKQNEFIKLNKMNQQDGISSYVTFFVDDIGKIKKPKKTLDKSMNQIRYWYKKFLILCHERKMDIFVYDNSQTIYDKSYEIFENKEKDLNTMRETYRKARYSEETIIKEDIKIIKSSYKNLENNN